MADEKPQPELDPKGPGKPPRPRPAAPAVWVLLILAALTLLMFTQQMGEDSKQVPYSFFRQQVLEGNVVGVRVEGGTISGEFREAPLAPSKPAVEGKDTKQPADGDTPENDSPKDNDGSEASQEDSSKEDSEKGKSAAPNEGDPDTSPSKTADAKRLPKKFFTYVQGGVDPELRKELEENGVEVTFVNPTDWGAVLTIVWFGVLIGLAFVMFSFFRSTRNQMMGGGMLGGVTKSPARRYDAEGAEKITFDDVAGLKGVKRDLKEIVDFLRDPEKFQKLGARVPKGVLLNGPPGTGKTLLAKAVAGEAGVPFFSINGSEFIQMFVGVGASRVRDMFKTAKKSAPSILFIDEIDAVGRQRGAGLGGGHDEREQTLNQILSEMDGFTPSETVIVIAATNRPDVLDPALLRPGRFDRHITVDRPSVDGRLQLFEVHSRKIPIAEDVDFEKLARATAGLTGADIANLVNEAALWATRHDRKFVTMEDFEFARDKALMGSARDEVLGDHERKVCAYHESGHALVAWLLPDCDRVHKVTIIPRGRALGVTQLVPDEDRHNMSQNELNAQLAMALGGRAAEKIAFDEYSVGASSDLERSTKLARRMVTHWGMSERLGPVAHHNGGDDPFLGREIVQEQRQFSEHTAQIIDDEVSKILHAAADRARRLLTDNRDKLEALTNALLEHEEIDDDFITKLIGPSAQNEKTAASPPIEIAPSPTAQTASPSRSRSE